MTHTFHASIRREYDVRGIVGDTLSEKDARALGRSYGALATTEGARRIAVGRDGRTHSPELQDALIEGLTQSGLDVVNVGMGPSPMLYFAAATLEVDGGIQVTGFEPTVAVPDVAAAASDARAAGGRILMEPTSLPGVGELVFLGDPGGNVVGAMTYASPRAA